MKSYSLKDYNGDIYWFSKEPICFINSWQVQFKDGDIVYYEAYLHREDGPAIEWTDGDKEWWWHGKFVDVDSREEFEQWKRFRNFR